MADSYSLKAIRVEITLGQGSFSEQGNQKIYEDFVIEVSVTKPGLPEKNSASIKIYNISMEDMEQLTTLAFKPLESQKNLVKILAGEKGGAMSTVFEGEITSAYADFNSVPDPCMNFEAETGSYPQRIAEGPLTVDGEAQAEKLFEQWAKSCGYTYKNEGLTASVANSWYRGSPFDKMRKLANDINCELIVDDGVVITMPAGQAREGEGILLRKDSGLVGHPTFNQDGICLKCLFDPALQYGGIVKVESIVPKASGEWKITKMTHRMTSNKPGGGDWLTELEAAYNE